VRVSNDAAMASLGINLCMGYVAFYTMPHVDIAHGVNFGENGGAWFGGAWGGLDNLDYGGIDLDAIGGLDAGLAGGGGMDGVGGGGDLDVGGMF